MILKLEQQIIEVVLTNQGNNLSIRQIAKLLKTSYPHVYNKTKELIKQNILIGKKIANATIPEINLDNDLSRNIVGHIELSRRNKWFKSHTNVKNFFTKITNLVAKFDIQSVFYYNSKIAICLDNVFFQNNLDSYIKSQFKEIHGSITYLTKRELKKYYTSKVINEKIILCNPEWYYSKLNELNHE